MNSLWLPALPLRLKRKRKARETHEKKSASSAQNAAASEFNRRQRRKQRTDSISVPLPPVQNAPAAQFRRTTQAQRPGARDATIATAMLPPGSLQRLILPLKPL